MCCHAPDLETLWVSVTGSEASATVLVCLRVGNSARAFALSLGLTKCARKATAKSEKIGAEGIALVPAFPDFSVTFLGCFVKPSDSAKVTLLCVLEGQPH